MADLLSGQISFSGLGSGTDFGSIVDQLKTVESIPFMQMESKRDQYEARIEAVDDIIKVMEEARETLAKLSSRDNFVKKDILFGNDAFITGKATGDASDADYRIDVANIAERSSIVNNDSSLTAKDAKLLSGGEFKYSIVVDGTVEERTIQIADDMTLEQLENSINNASDNPGIRMVVNESSSGKVNIGFTSEETGAGQKITIEDDTAIKFFGTKFGGGGEGADAAYTVDGFAQTSSSNDLTIADGVTVSIFDKGVSTISVKTDKEEVKKSIQEFLDAINSVIKEIDSHTNINVDAEEVKEESSLNSVNDPNEDLLSSYLDDLVSAAPTVTGNVLTGEYGVTSLDSRISNILTSLSPGFTRKASEDDASGDLIASLTEMGIKINGVEGSPNYGLFEIAPESASETSKVPQLDQDRFDKYLEDNLDEVVDFFTADFDMKTSSSGFFVSGSIIEGQAEPGVYDVKYEINPDGSIKDDLVLINGEPAIQEGDSRLYTATAGGARGIAIQISETRPGEYFNETLKVQQGKISQIADMLGDEIVPYSKVTPSENGAVSILKNGYEETLESLEDQLWKEEARLDSWENRKKLEFARLETLLSKYNGISETLASQLGGLL